MKKIMIMMVMMLTIVVSTSGKNNTSVSNDRNMRNDRNVTVVVNNRHNHGTNGTSWRGKKRVCTCKCHKLTPCCGKPTPPCKKCFKQMRKGTHPMPRR